MARHLIGSIVWMLLPLVAVAGVGFADFRASVAALEAFDERTIDEGKSIDSVREMLPLADDLGELHVENQDPATGERFEALHEQIDRGFNTLARLDTSSEREMASRAEARWEQAVDALDQAAMRPTDQNGDSLDPFHDALDEAGSMLATLYSMNREGVSDEVAAMRFRQQVQLLAALVALVIGAILAFVLALRIRRSIATPLLRLEQAATQFAGGDLTHRVDVVGNDEVARLGEAFNAMAGKLKKSRDALEHQALHDPLTGLPNRTLFFERSEQALLRARPRGVPTSVLCLDLDDFKRVNDSLGHEMGDQVLVAVAKRLRGSINAEDTVARLGGDEFGVLLEDADLATATLTAKRLIRSLTGPWAVAGRQVPISVSIGIATGQGEEELDQLVQQADVAMYAAMTAGNGSYRAFGPSLGADVLAAETLRAELQQAMNREEFVIHYQPIVDFRTGTIDAVEALVRWNHPERGLLPPAAFLHEAEDTGHILEIDRWVVREACKQVRTWQRIIPGAAELSLHVNLSATRLKHPGVAGEIAETLRSSGLAPEHLIVELTETTLVLDTEAAAKDLGRLKELQVQIALDDFGTGFSSLSYLLRFPIDIIKIDRTFVSAIGGEERRDQVAEALVSLGRTLNLRVVAEGIEDVDQLDYLRSIGCDQGQGYYFAKPLAATELESFLSLPHPWFPPMPGQVPLIALS